MTPKRFTAIVILSAAAAVLVGTAVLHLRGSSAGTDSGPGGWADSPAANSVSSSRRRHDGSEEQAPVNPKRDKGGRSEPLSESDAKQEASQGLKTMSVRSLVSGLINLADRGDQKGITQASLSIARYGDTAKTVISEKLEHPDLSEAARTALRSTYEQIP